jgi:hypothetical protein
LEIPKWIHLVQLLYADEKEKIDHKQGKKRTWKNI